MLNIKIAIKKFLPFMFSYFFVGIAFGIYMRQAGFDIFYVFLSSLLVYAGSMQFVMVTLLVGGAPIYAVAAMTFFINSRHIFYGIGFIDEFKKIAKTERFGFLKYPYMALTMTDETYAMLCTLDCPKEASRPRVMFYIQFFSHMFWVLGTTLSAFLGDFIPFDMAGIEFSATAFFVVVVINQWLSFPSKLPIITGLCSALLFIILLGNGNFMLPALLASCAVLIFLKGRLAPKFGGDAN